MNETKPNLDDYLEAQAVAGTLTDSSNFTLDEVKAQKKLAAAQLPEPTLWPVKMVQAAVSGGAPEILFKFNRSSVTVEFFASRDLTATRLVELLTTSILPADPFLLHLITGLRTSVGNLDKKLSVTTVGNSRLDAVVLGTERFHRTIDQETFHEQTLFQFELQRPSMWERLKRGVRSAFGKNADELFQLLTRCWCSPIPIQIDGRYIQTGYDSPLQFYGDHSRAGHTVYALDQENFSFFYGLKALPAASGEPSMPAPSLGPRGTYTDRTLGNGETIKIRRPVYRNQTFLNWVYEGDQCGLVVALYKHAVPASWLSYICDGAVVQRLPLRISRSPSDWKERISRPVYEGLCVAKAVTIEDCDLSQFSVKRASQRRAEILTDALPVIRDILAVTLVERKSFRAISISEKNRKPVLGATTFTGIAASAALMNPIPVLGLGFVAAVLMGQKSGGLGTEKWLERFLQTVGESEAKLPEQPDLSV